MLIFTRVSKPWQAYDMNLYRAIRNCMNYWFARLILEQRAPAAQAYSCRIHPEERLAISRRNYAKRYWRLRRAGLTGTEVAAKMWGLPIDVYKAQAAERRRRRAAKFGGYPTAGTEAYNRMVLSWSSNAKGMASR